MLSNNAILLVGLPDSGKSTFLAALWHQIESGEIPTTFIAAKLQSEREYLNRIRDTWLLVEQIPRTPVGMKRLNTLHLEHSKSKEKFDVLIPDVAGESFYSQWSDRQVTEEYANQVKSTHGLLIFIHSKHVFKSDLIGKPKRVHTLSPSLSAEAWLPSTSSTQVKLVDILQTALKLYENDFPLRTAFIISAWDEVENVTTPNAWFERNLPLLEQFRRSNSDTIKSEVFGLSAMGGSLNMKPELEAITTPSTRVRIQINSDIFHDITIPLAFLFASDT